jgi:hypothetical protein
MKLLLATFFLVFGLQNLLLAQQQELNWTHVYTNEGEEHIITEFEAPVDSVLLRYECWPKEHDNHLELRTRLVNRGFAADTSYISCSESVKISAHTQDSTYIDFVPQKMLRSLTRKENPDWFNKK